MDIDLEKPPTERTLRVEWNLEEGGRGGRNVDFVVAWSKWTPGGGFGHMLLLSMALSSVDFCQVT